jgi:hypothetical protein
MAPDDGGHPLVTIRYGIQNTVIVAAVNCSTIPAKSHKIDARTVVLVLKNHAGWKNGMTRIHFVTFKYESDANEFKETYNEFLSRKLTKNDRRSAEYDSDKSDDDVSDEEVVDELKESSGGTIPNRLVAQDKENSKIIASTNLGKGFGHDMISETEISPSSDDENAEEEEDTTLVACG